MQTFFVVYMEEEHVYDGFGCAGGGCVEWSVGAGRGGRGRVARERRARGRGARGPQLAQQPLPAVPPHRDRGRALRRRRRAPPPRRDRLRVQVTRPTDL